MTDDARALLVEHLDRRLAKAQGRVQQHFAKLTEARSEDSPRYLVFELEWADSLFASAVEADVLERVHSAMVAENSKATFETVKGHALDQALGKAARGQSSTSSTHNLVSRYEAAAWADVAQLIRDIERGWL